MVYTVLFTHKTWRIHPLMCGELRELGSTSRFDTSDSSPVGLRLLEYNKVNTVYVETLNLLDLEIPRTGSNSQNTYRVREAGSMGQASSLLKADGAGSMTPKRSRQRGNDYFKVGRGVS